MRIGGLNKFSLSDFRGRKAAVVFTQGCNFHCPYCHNSSLMAVDILDCCLIPEEQFFEFLRSRSKQLDGVVVSGGEPTIQPDLPQFLSRIKAEGFSVKLDTNGSQPHVLRKVLQNKLVDFIAMDVKAPLHTYTRLVGVEAPIEQIMESIELIAKSEIDYEFRTTVVKPLLSPEDIAAIEKLIPSGSTHRLQQFRPKHARDPALRAPGNPNLGGQLL